MSGLCGIVGSLPEPELREGLARMMKAGDHRGPDGARQEVWPGVALGHHLFRVRGDLDAPQPLASEDGGVRVVLDGDIQNDDVLRGAFPDAPRRFGDRASQAELVLAAYRKHGSRFPEALEGLFAVALWDDATRTLTCARDRFGVKPLFYATWRGAFAFASEIGQILALPGFSRRANETMVGEYLAGDIDLSHETFFAGIHRLPAGSVAVIRNGTPALTAYWELDPSRPIEPDDDRACGERFRALLESAVRRSLNVELPAGSNLSGGLDSSSIVCLVDRLRRVEGATKPFQTFSLAFDDRMVDESQHVAAVEAETHIQHRQYRSDSEDIFQHIPAVQARQAEPMRSLGIVLFWRLKQLVAETDCRVILNGMGADEVLGGINLYYLADMVREGRVQELRGALDTLIKYDPYSLGMGRSALLRTFGLRPLLPPAIRRLRRRVSGESGTPDFLDRGFAARTGLADRLIEPPRSPFPDQYRTWSYDGFRRRYTPLLLHYEDASNAGFRLESRFPFLDRELVEFLFALPRGQKTRDARAKIVLRNGMAGILPDSVRNRVDKGFIDRRIDHWMGDQYREMVESVLWGPELKESGWFDMPRLQALYREYQAGANHRFAIWKSFNLGIWLRLFMHSGSGHGDLQH